MACPEITFEQITPELYETLLAEAKGAGITVTGGKAFYQEIEFDWSYDIEAQRFTVQVEKKPLLLPCVLIEEKIRGLVHQIAGTRGT